MPSRSECCPEAHGLGARFRNGQPQSQDARAKIRPPHRVGRIRAVTCQSRSDAARRIGVERQRAPSGSRAGEAGPRATSPGSRSLSGVWSGAILRKVPTRQLRLCDRSAMCGPRRGTQIRPIARERSRTECCPGAQDSAREPHRVTEYILAIRISRNRLWRGFR